MSKYINAVMLIVGLAIGMQVPLSAVDVPEDQKGPEDAVTYSTALRQKTPNTVGLEKADEATAVDTQIENLLFGMQEAIASVSTAVSAAFTLDVSPSSSSSNRRENIRYTGGAKFVSVK